MCENIIKELYFDLEPIKDEDKIIISFAEKYKLPVREVRNHHYVIMNDNFMMGFKGIIKIRKGRNINYEKGKTASITVDRYIRKIEDILKESGIECPENLNNFLEIMRMNNSLSKKIKAIRKLISNNPELLIQLVDDPILKLYGKTPCYIHEDYIFLIETALRAEYKILEKLIESDYISITEDSIYNYINCYVVNGVRDPEYNKKVKLLGATDKLIKRFVESKDNWFIESAMKNGVIPYDTKWMLNNAQISYLNPIKTSVEDLLGIPEDRQKYLLKKSLVKIDDPQEYLRKSLLYRDYINKIDKFLEIYNIDKNLALREADYQILFGSENFKMMLPLLPESQLLYIFKLAFYVNNSEIARLVLTKYPDINKNDQDNYCLRMASIHGNYELVKLLI